jgi:hypothetical protein
MQQLRWIKDAASVRQLSWINHPDSVSSLRETEELIEGKPADKRP